MRVISVEELSEIVGSGWGSSGTQDSGSVVIGGQVPIDPDGPGSGGFSFPPYQGGGGGGGSGSLPPCSPNSNPQANRVNKNFTINHEGGLRTQGYTLPSSRFPNSGLTISVGVDLGYLTLRDLQNMNLSQATINLLVQYLGFKGADAEAIAARLGYPSISESDALLRTR